ncbi:RING-H2 finger protein ATL3-like [Andrographis paniculata]|uniref:RING-H2 finger protein ATL3-like n=1 Tax=Andrographis paniculata TaxID=175694 RepID=UPI0021E8B3C2|nr:RING-H2 finger protein ATL3-like [Andrographis paniculata]
MADSLDGNSRLTDGNAIELTGKIMVVAIIILLFVVVFVACLHLYARWVWHRRRESGGITTGGRQERAAMSALRHGLNPSVLKAIPVVVFDPNQFKDGLECAVCLSEVSEGEKARFLPKCNHGFHVDCIDMWFHSHSTCPLCRNPVANESSGAEAEVTLEDILQAPAGENSTEAPSFPTNVLFWGDETTVSTFSPCVEENHQGGEPSSASSSSSAAAVAASASNRPDGVVAIDIPMQSIEDEQKSPIPTRFRSLKRLLSGNRRVNPSSPRNSDIEQGGTGQV